MLSKHIALYIGVNQLKYIHYDVNMIRTAL